MTEVIEATFTGQRSLGYERGKTYRLIIHRGHPLYPVQIIRVEGGGYCPYASEAAFRRNWSVGVVGEPAAESQPQEDDGDQH